MKISQLIVNLQKAQAEYGDVPVLLSDLNLEYAYDVGAVVWENPACDGDKTKAIVLEMHEEHQWERDVE